MKMFSVYRFESNDTCYDEENTSKLFTGDTYSECKSWIIENGLRITEEYIKENDIPCSFLITDYYLCKSNLTTIFCFTEEAFQNIKDNIYMYYALISYYKKNGELVVYDDLKNNPLFSNISYVNALKNYRISYSWSIYGYNNYFIRIPQHVVEFFSKSEIKLLDAFKKSFELTSNSRTIGDKIIETGEFSYVKVSFPDFEDLDGHTLTDEEIFNRLLTACQTLYNLDGIYKKKENRKIRNDKKNKTKKESNDPDFYNKI